MGPEHPLPRRPAPFKPRFTVMLFYVAAFFVLYALLFVAPDLIPLLGPEGQALAPDELQARAQQVAHEAMQGKVFTALVASLATVGIGVWRDVLPGVR